MILESPTFTQTYLTLRTQLVALSTMALKNIRHNQKEELISTDESRQTPENIPELYKGPEKHFKAIVIIMFIKMRIKMEENFKASEKSK